MKKSILKTETDRKGVSLEICNEYAKKLSRMIDCKTVWTREDTNKAEFERFYGALEELFPCLTAKAERLTFGGGCFVYIIRGKNAKKNILLMSHHDVVEGSDDWSTDPFVAAQKDGYLYGRGTIDTISFANIFFHLVAYLFVLLMASFALHKVFSWIYPYSFICAFIAFT